MTSPSPSLKQIVLEHISDEVRQMKPEATQEISLAELGFYAWKRGYEGSVLDLVKAADSTDIENEGWEGFHWKVVEPLARKQGGFFNPARTKELLSLVYLGQRFPSMYEPIQLNRGTTRPYSSEL